LLFRGTCGSGVYRVYAFAGRIFRSSWTSSDTQHPE
jgi:hypothetical protein